MNLTNFSIFKNDKKKEGSNQPDYRISAKVGDVYEEIGGGWIKDSKSGKYISCSVKEPTKKEEVSPAKVQTEAAVVGTDGQEIPF
jgi:uncharacterized protein (DUF736 family)